jgi:hypothetical protein
MSKDIVFFILFVATVVASANGQSVNLVWRVNRQALVVSANGNGVAASGVSGDPSQLWTVDSATKLITASNGKCLAAPPGAQDHDAPLLVICDPNDANQQWQQDTDTLQLHIVGQPSYCLDSGGTWEGPWIYFCLPSDHKSLKDQVLELRPPPQQKQLINVATNRALARGSGTHVTLSVTSSAATQQWVYDANTRHITSSAGTCLDAFHPRNNGAVHLATCNTANPNLRWTYDATTLQIRHNSHAGFCLDSGGPWLLQCLPRTHASIRNQQFQMQPVSAG